MRVRYIQTAGTDCTSDPHPVSYADKKTKRARIATMLADIIRVCESDMVAVVRNVRVTLGGVVYESDTYTDWAGGNRKRKLAKDDMAKKHKTYGAYFGWDADAKSKHLPPGLTGLKEIAKLIVKRAGALDSLSVGVVWKFAGQASCADYIKIEEDSAKNTVDYGSQNWWKEKKGYKPWCTAMENLLNRSFPAND